MSVTSIHLTVKCEKNHWEQYPKRLVYCSLRNSGCKQQKNVGCSYWYFLNVLHPKLLISEICDNTGRCMKLGMLLQTIFHPIVTRLGCKEKQEKISLTTYMNLYLSVSLLSSHISVSLHSVECTQCLVVKPQWSQKLFLVIFES